MIDYNNLTTEQKAEVDEALKLYFYLEHISDVNYMEFAFKVDFWETYYWSKLPCWITKQMIVKKVIGTPNNTQHKTKTPSCKGVEVGGGC